MNHIFVCILYVHIFTYTMCLYVSACVDVPRRNNVTIIFLSLPLKRLSMLMGSPCAITVGGNEHDIICTWASSRAYDRRFQFLVPSSS